MKHLLPLFLAAFVTSVSSFGEYPPPQPTEKIASHSTWSLGFGPAFLSSLKVEGVGLGLEAGRTWDVQIASVKVFSTFALRGSAYFGQFGLGVAKFMVDEDTSPYLAADLGYGFSKPEVGWGQSASGFVLGAGGGVQLFRRSDIQVDAGLRFALLLKDTALGHPSLTLFRVSVLF